MRRFGKTALWVYLIGIILAELLFIRFTFVGGGFHHLNTLGELVHWQAIILLYALAWPLLLIGIAFQFMGFDI